MRLRNCIRQLFLTASCISLLAAHTLAQTAGASQLALRKVTMPSPAQSTIKARRIWEERPVQANQHNFSML